MTEGRDDYLGRASTNMLAQALCTPRLLRGLGVIVIVNPKPCLTV